MINPAIRPARRRVCPRCPENLRICLTGLLQERPRQTSRAAQEYSCTSDLDESVPAL